MALFCLEKQCLGLFRGFFVVFSWFFRGPCFGQILRVLALEQSSDWGGSRAPEKRARGAPPGTKNHSGHVKSGL